MIEDYLLLSICWIAYYAIHSLLASGPVKRFLRHFQPYRFIYSLVSAVGMVGIIYITTAVEQVHIFESSWVNICLGLPLFTLGSYLVFRSFQYLPTGTFLGFQQESNPPELITKGIHSVVRHPIYTGTILIFVGAWLFFPTISVGTGVIITVIYIPLGIYWEEQKLIMDFGESYRRYKQRTPAIWSKKLLF